jgi:transposase
MLMLLGLFEGIDSEREIAWRAADSLSLRQFLGYGDFREGSRAST